MTLRCTPDTTRIGWIGTGVMGASMCGHLLDGGLRATVFSGLGQSRAAAGAGRAWADSPRRWPSKRRHLHDRRFSRDVREVFWAQTASLAGVGGQRARRHDDQRAIAGHRDRPKAARREVRRDRCPRLRRRRRGPRRRAVDHDRRRRDRRCLGPCWQAMGRRWSARAARRRATHQNGQPDADRDQHDRRLRGAALRIQGRAGPGDGDESVASGAAGSWSLSNLGPRMIAGNSTPAFSSSTSSRTWASPWTRPSGWASSPRPDPRPASCTAVAAQGHARGGTHL